MKNFRSFHTGLHITAILVLLLCLGAAPWARAAEYTGKPRDLKTISLLKTQGKQYVSQRSILWVESGYLTEEVISDLHQRIDKGISDIESFLGMPLDVKAYGKDKIEYFIHSKKTPSHTITAYEPGKHMHPVIFLTYAHEGKTPYLHETVHIIAWDWHSLWIKEGLAIYLNDQLGGFPAFPNQGKDIDRMAKNAAKSGTALAKIGQNGVPELSDRKERRAFYILAGSLVKYMYGHIAKDKMMQIYLAKDTSQAVNTITGKSLTAWKAEWLESINK